MRCQHWDLIHKSDVEKTCEFCGKLFKNSRQLREHLRSHDESNHCTCETCGKGFKNHYALRKHAKWHDEPQINCPLCDETFLYQDAVQTHLVRKHNQPRKYTCDICGTQFIHQKHWRRHMNKHQNNPEKTYRTQPIRRGYTKNTQEYWSNKPGHKGPLPLNGPDHTYAALPMYEVQPQLVIPPVTIPNYQPPRDGETRIHEVS